MSSRTVLAAIIVLSATASVAHANDWSFSTDHKYAGATSIRVVEPEGFKVSIGERTDTVPAVFQLPDRDDYVVVRMTAPDGATWEKKVEVKSRSQTILKVGYKKPPAAEEPKTAPSKRRSYIGRAINSTNKCRAKERFTSRFDFLLGGEAQKSVELVVGGRADVELVEGEYEVRVWVKGSADWAFLTTKAVSISKDGWVYDFGCGK